MAGADMYDRLRSENGKKTEKARNALISLIRDRKLQPGDKLPNQKELIQCLGLSATTVMRAVNALKGSGYLDVRNKVGVFLRKAELDSLIGRTIGLTSLHLEGGSPFYCYLVLAIQSRLLKAGCKTVSFFRREVVEKAHLRLTDCFGLKEALKEKSLDGIVDVGGFCKASLEQLRHSKVSYTYIGFSENPPHGIVLDMVFQLKRSLEVLCKKGCRRIGVMMSDNPAALFSVYSERQAELDPGVDPERFYLVSPSITDGRKHVASILAMPEDERPDGFVFLDEYIGMDFWTAMKYVEPGYRPWIVSSRSPQVPIPCIDDNIIFFQKDIEQLAAMAVEHLLRQLRGDPAERREIYRCGMEFAPPYQDSKIFFQQQRLKHKT